MFRTLVDNLAVMIEQAQFTPMEVREAAMLAQILYEERHLPRWYKGQRLTLNEVDDLRRNL